MSSRESKKPVKQGAFCFWQEKLGLHKQGHCLGTTENSLLPTYLATLFAEHDKGDVEPPDSILC